MKNSTKYNEERLTNFLNTLEDIDTTHVVLVERDGYLILEGHVNSYPKIFQLQERIQSEISIPVLLNSLEVRAADQKTREDSDICNDIVEAIRLNKSFQHSGLRYSIREAVVTITGLVKSPEDIEIAEQLLKSIDGVDEVLNQVKIDA